jgi:enolase
MRENGRIKTVTGRQIFDSRGTPTVEAEVTLESGIRASAAVPSGASTGKFEACELRDGGDAYGGKGVQTAASHITNEIQERLAGRCVYDQAGIDGGMRELDGTDNKSALGANAILAVSLACARAAAASLSMELYRYIGGVRAAVLPVPMMNILNGGAHAGNNIDIQEFMIVPVGAGSFRNAMRMGTGVYSALSKALKERKLSTAVGDEGGYAPDLDGDEEALSLLTEAIERAGYRPGEDVCIAIDAAASEWAREDGYVLPKKGTRLTREELISHFDRLSGLYPLISVEDPLGEEDFDGFTQLTDRLGGRFQVVGDDLFVTNPTRLIKGIGQRSASAVLVKPNQIGTLSESMETVRLAQTAGYGAILSHRSGETEDTSIADIAVGLNAGQIKTGAPARSERVCKYNRLLKIEEELGDAAVYPGLQAFARRH